MNGRLSQVILAAVLLLTIYPVSSADEGMWLLDSIEKLPIANLKARGLRLNPDEIYDSQGRGIANAVVRIGGGTGSFVSDQGLIITNHHVAFTAVQRQSTPERDYLTDGFCAGTREEELPAIGYGVYVLKSFRDVTTEVLGTVGQGMTDLERYLAIEKVSKQIIRKAEEGQDVRCKLASMYEGGQYYLFTYFKIRDVRLVYAPPRGIGDYGGEIDNWMWPRHVGDFAFFRAYVSPEGSSSEYSQKNVPYHPKAYLTLSSAGVKRGDWVMLIGFPGTTRRYESSFSIGKMVDHDYPRDIRTRRDLISVLEATSANDSSVAMRLSSQIKGLNNYLKKNQGMLEGFKRAHVLERKIQTENSLKIGLGRYPKLRGEYEQVLPGLDSLFRESQAFQDKGFLISWMTRYCKFLDFASAIYKRALEIEKADQDREPGYQDRDTAQTRQRLEDAQVNLVPSVDREIFVYFLKRALQLPPEQKIEAIEDIVEGIAETDRYDILEEFAVDLYGGTRLGSVENRLKAYGMRLEELERMNDAFIEFASRFEVERERLRRREKEFSGALTRLQPKLIEAHAKYRGTEVYPDANGTMRFNYGEVRGYSPRDAVSFGHITTLDGVMEKDAGEEPFDVPVELEEIYSRKDFGPYLDVSLGDIPVNFLTTNDVTNGNSGSPVMNGRGNLVGLVFDGNYESISSDFLFEPAITRTINVDIRYVLFLLDKVYHAESVLKELTIQ